MIFLFRASDRINLYPAAPIRLATMLRTWTIAERGMGLIFSTAPSPSGHAVTHPTRQQASFGLIASLPYRSRSGLAKPWSNWHSVSSGPFGRRGACRLRRARLAPCRPGPVRLYEALAVKVVLVCVASPSLSLVTPLFPGRVLR